VGGLEGAHDMLREFGPSRAHGYYFARLAAHEEVGLARLQRMDVLLPFYFFEGRLGVPEVPHEHTALASAEKIVAVLGKFKRSNLPLVADECAHVRECDHVPNVHTLIVQVTSSGKDHLPVGGCLDARDSSVMSRYLADFFESSDVPDLDLLQRCRVHLVPNGSNGVDWV